MYSTTLNQFTSIFVSRFPYSINCDCGNCVKLNNVEQGEFEMLKKENLQSIECIYLKPDISLKPNIKKPF